MAISVPSGAFKEPAALGPAAAAATVDGSGELLKTFLYAKDQLRHCDDEKNTYLGNVGWRILGARILVSRVPVRRRRTKVNDPSGHRPPMCHRHSSGPKFAVAPQAEARMMQTKPQFATSTCVCFSLGVLVQFPAVPFEEQDECFQATFKFSTTRRTLEQRDFRLRRYRGIGGCIRWVAPGPHEGGALSGHDIILGRGVVVDGARAGARAYARGLAVPPRLR